MMTIKVLVTDSSLDVCNVLSRIINQQNNMQVVGIAHSPFEARSKIKELQPDVLTLSVEFPKMNGLDFLEKIMMLRPMPVIIISKLAANNSVIYQQAHKRGACACIHKPSLNQFSQMAPELINKIISASQKKFQSRAMNEINAPANKIESDKYVIAIGASTGGTEAITVLLKEMPLNCPGIVITQHMPKGFTASFAARLTSICSINVCEAKHNELIKPGNAYIAPGDTHLEVQKKSGLYYTFLSDADPINLHKPSIDHLFNSMADCVKTTGIGIILTGMGKDGATGLLKMKQCGAKTFAQDEETSVVYGMPKEAMTVGAVNHQLALQEIVPTVLQYLKS